MMVTSGTNRSLQVDVCAGAQIIAKEGPKSLFKGMGASINARCRRSWVSGLVRPVTEDYVWQGVCCWLRLGLHALQQHQNDIGV
jgi:hypothetical protein